MGISANCGDAYENSLDCQWIDLTGLPAGFYTLVVRVNWDKSPDKTGRPEARYDNNWAQACFRLKFDSDGNPAIEEKNDCPMYADCFGETFGPAQPDCSGECGGVLLHGDWDLDTLRAMSDIEQYLAVSLDGSATATPCFDLDADGDLDVYDAAPVVEVCFTNKLSAYFAAGVGSRADVGIDAVRQQVLQKRRRHLYLAVQARAVQYRHEVHEGRTHFAGFADVQRDAVDGALHADQ